jgi:hypothetical protein
VGGKVLVVCGQEGIVRVAFQFGTDDLLLSGGMCDTYHVTFCNAFSGCLQPLV